MSKVWNHHGQSLMETLFVIPIMVTLLSGGLILAYHWLCHYWVDHGVYQATLCLAGGKDPKVCRSQLLQWNAHIPGMNLKIQNFSQYEFRATVTIINNGYGPKKQWHSELKRPLSSNHFRGRYEQ